MRYAETKPSVMINDLNFQTSSTTQNVTNYFFRKLDVYFECPEFDFELNGRFV